MTLAVPSEKKPETEKKGRLVRDKVYLGAMCADCVNKARAEGQIITVIRPAKRIFCTRCAKNVRKGFEVNQITEVWLDE